MGDNFFPNNCVQMDFAEHGGDYIIMCDQMSGFLQIFKCRNKSSSEAILKLREWERTWGMPTLCVQDNGPGFLKTFAVEAGKLRVRVEHSSANNPSSQASVEWGGGWKSKTLTQEI